MLGLKKSGFTFVELAIVLVIIGIIMGMAIKGRTLIETATTRSEVRKIEKIQASVATWFGDAGDINAFRKATAGGDNCSAISADLTGLECLDRSVLRDLKSTDLKAPTDNWSILKGAYTTDNVNEENGFGAGSSFLLYLSQTSPRFACNVETLLDDKNRKTSDARFPVAIDEEIDTVTKTYYGCSDAVWTNNIVTNGWLTYLLL